LVTFNCGGPATIAISTGTGSKTISGDTTIDGGGLVTISGGNQTAYNRGAPHGSTSEIASRRLVWSDADSDSYSHQQSGLIVLSGEIGRGTCRLPPPDAGQRSAATQARLLDAALECLVELGYAGTATRWSPNAPASHAVRSCTTSPLARRWSPRRSVHRGSRDRAHGAGSTDGPGTYNEQQPPAEPRVHIDRAAQRTVEALGEPTGIVVIVD
jgi:hypothetical protein